jgi:hypothetical protein
MSITPPTGILDITDAIVRVSKLEFRGATGFDTILNNVARNTILLVDQNVEYTADKAWGLKLPNAWVSEFDAYWDSGASGNIDFNIYNNTTSGTNGYVISMDDTTITVTYDGGSALETVSLGSTLRNDTWRKIHILFERDMISLALDGTRVLYFKDTLIRPRVYDEESGYVIASGLSADRKVKNLRILNGDKWMTDNTSNIAFVHGNVGIGTTQAAYTLDVKGDIRATGNLLIEGLTTTVDTQNLSIEDAIVEIGRGNDGGTSGKDVGFLFTRNNGADTTNSNVALIYDESTDRLTFGYSDGSPTASTLAINTSKSLSVVIPSGNLGIGTASPVSILHVRGTGQTSTTSFDTSQTLGASIFVQSSDSTVGSGGSLVLGTYQGKFAAIKAGILDGTSNTMGNLHFMTRNATADATLTNRMTITNTGNVGIGTVSPRALLDVSGPVDVPAILTSGASSSEGDIAVLSGEAMQIGHWDNGTSTFTNRIHINSSGNVGIGTASPEYKLDVAGTAPYLSITDTRTSSGGAWGLDLGGIVFRTKDATDPIPETGDFLAKIQVKAQNNGSFPDGSLNFFVSDDGDLLSSPSMVIEGVTGNVGIGTDNPKQTFEVDSSGYGLFSGRLGVGNVLTSAQNGGGQDIWNLGTSAKLVVRCTNSAYPAATYANSRTYAGIALVPSFDASDTTNIGLWGTNSGENPVFYIQNQVNNGNNGGGYVALQPVGGYVGIGTTSPQNKLTVKGNSVAVTTDPSVANYGQFEISSSSYAGWAGANRPTKLKMGIDHSVPSGGLGSAFIQGVVEYINAAVPLLLCPKGGNVGIGTTNPSSKLDVDQNGEGNYIARFRNTSTGADEDARIAIEASSSSGETQLIFITTDGTTKNLWHITAGSGDTPTLGFFYSANDYNGGTNAGYIARKSDSASLNFTGQHRTFIKDIPFSQAGYLEGLIVSADQSKYIKMSGGVETGSNAITTNESLPVVSLSTKVNDKKCFGVVSTSEDPETREEAYGNFVSVSNKEVGDTRVYINSVGEGAIWVVNTNGSLESGDYITTSNVAGYGQKQDDDILHNYTVAKITMDCDFDPATQPLQIIKKELANVNYWVKTTYSNVSVEEYSNLAVDMRTSTTETYYSNEDGEISVTEYSNLESNVQSTYTELTRTVYQMISKEELKTETEGYDVEVREELVNVLDEHGQLQWEDHPTETEKAYKIRYLDAAGVQTDEANAVHIAAFVGVTYHCG